MKHTSCINTQIEDNAAIFCASPAAICTTDFSATERRASFGHLENQSIVQQFTNDGNIRHRCLYSKSF